MNDVYAIILGGGIGARAQSKIPKQFLSLGNKSVLEQTIETFNNHNEVDAIVIVINPEFGQILKDLEISKKYKKVLHVVDGGTSRRESAYHGIKILPEQGCKVLIHDGVRPFVSQETISRCIMALDYHDAVYPAVESADTLVEVDDEFIVKKIPQRKYMMRGQTPQGFKIEIIKKAHLLSQNDPNVDDEVTNDCGLIYRYNLGNIKVVKGNRENVKITYPEDLAMIRRLYVDETRGKIDEKRTANVDTISIISS
ncbi:MAG: 2-C-methyl-D-erythritol 4-phosphate cytidylyltransferase [Bacteroidales bacterium]|nr:2-C-methyl-D-erythritol 4-phosphate cytidylyltransferase [Bacteroidales bacterium]